MSEGLDAPEPTPRTILVVDDEEDILSSLQDLLEAALEDVTVTTCPSGTEALEELGSGTFDLIISDYKMPGMNGLEFLAEARRVAPSTPRIMMTAFPDLDVAIHAINDAGIENFFTKPLEPEQILQVVQGMITNRISKVNREQAFARAMELLRRRGAEA